MKEKVNSARTKEEQANDVKRKISNIEEQIAILSARKTILESQLKRLNPNE